MQTAYTELCARPPPLILPPSLPINPVIGKENPVSRFLFLSALVLAGVAAAPSPVSAQRFDQTFNQKFDQARDRLHLQLHGYAAQGFVYSTHNNWDLMDSTSGSFNWSDGVINLSSQPTAKLRVGAQARYFRLGGIQNKVTLDWAQADFKLNEHFGARGGKVKTPVGLLNESQDIDPAQLWVLLPQSVYNIASRNAILAHNGGVLYGTFPLGESFGKLEYRGFGGQRYVAGDDGYLQATRDQGFTIPNGVSGYTAGDPSAGSRLRAASCSVPVPPPETSTEHSITVPIPEP